MTTAFSRKRIFSTLGLAGLLSAGLPLSAAAADLFIDVETPEFSEMLEEGAVRAVVNYVPLTQVPISSNNFRVRIFYEGAAIANLSSRAVVPHGPASVTVEDLDSDGVAEVRITESSGGHRCCLDTTLYALGEDGFREVDTRLVDGGLTGAWVEDLNGDGYSEVVKADEAFWYRFTPFIASSAPPQILTYRQGAFADTTREFPDRLTEHLAKLEKIFDSHSFVHAPNDLLADYVATKAMLGEFDEAWAFMLENYDPYSDWDLPIRDESGEIVGEYPDYPTALRAFLEGKGYL